MIASKFWHLSHFWEKRLDGLQYIGAQAPLYWSPFSSKTCFLFYFRTCITLNQRFPVHLIDPHVTHKTWFYHNFFSSFLARILKIKFWGSNILELSNVPGCLHPPKTAAGSLVKCNFHLCFLLSLYFPLHWYLYSYVYFLYF